MAKRIRKILYYIAVFTAVILIWLVKMIPDRKITNRNMLLYIDTGLGDLIMMLPMISLLVKNYDVTFRCLRPHCVEIARGMFPEARTIDNIILNKFNQIPYFLALWTLPYKFSYCVVPIDCMGWYSFLELLPMRIPVRIGHNWKKWRKFFTFQVDFQYSDHYVKGCLEITKAIGIFDNPNVFFKTESINIPFDNYIALHPNSCTDKRKNFPKDFWKDKIPADKPVILLGNHSESGMNVNIPNRIWDMRGKTNLFQAAYIIKHSETFYCIEGGLGHIGAATGANTVVYHKFHGVHSRVFHHLSNIKYIETDFMWC